MIKLLEHTRRPDITFQRNGRINITARIARMLNLCPGDSINILINDGECLLGALHHNNIGRHVASVHPTKKGSSNYSANSVSLCRAFLDYCNFTGPRAAFMVGLPMEVAGTVYLPIIYKMPL